MRNRHQIAYRLWLEQHPDFEFQDYAQWVRQQGIEARALVITCPEFYEYATAYQERRTLPERVSSPGVRPFCAADCD